MQGRVLIASGTDSGGGAGVQADIKTVMALGGYALTAVTALTAQNTRGVFGVCGIEPDFIQLQMRVVLEDIGADALKTGMLHDIPVIEAVAEVLNNEARGLLYVSDPVMVAQSGDRLLEPRAVEALKAHLVPRSDLLTPNAPEAETLTGLEVKDLDGMRAAAEALLAMGARAVLVKGGHLDGPDVQDLLADGSDMEIFQSPRIDTSNTHGTGCTLATAIATGLAQDLALRDAVARARTYLQEALRQAPGLGHGHGPVHHGHTVKSFPG